MAELSTIDVFDVTLPASPYPGLRRFEKDEWPIFFGRETMTDEVIRRLIGQQLLVVHGDSGCGKSSLLRAGVLARLEQDNARGGIVWRTCVSQPGDAPLQLLAESLAGLDGHKNDDARTIEIRRVLNFGADAPAALMRLLRSTEADHICILIDQFEELFAFAKRHGPEEARVLVQFLVAVHDHPVPGLYAVVTMRSEFLGTCARFPGLAEAVNGTQYLLPRMVHPDLIRAIREPATLYSGKVSVELAERVILEAGGGQDQLPLIQHGLRMLHRRKTKGATGPWQLEASDYNTAGSLAQLLSDHADELCQSIDERIVETLFRALTDINAEGQAIRRPQSVARLMQVTAAGRQGLDRVLNTLRSEEASFLSPYGTDPIPDDVQVDISHEALIRCWRKIADHEDGWLIREFRDGLVWKTLIVQADSFDRNASNILSPAAAAEYAKWLAPKNAAWAERYGGNWERGTKLIEASVQAGKVAERKHRFQRNLLAIVMTAVALLVTGLWIVYARGAQQREVAAEQTIRAKEALADSAVARAQLVQQQTLTQYREILQGAKEASDRTEYERAALLAWHSIRLARGIKDDQLVADVTPVLQAALMGLRPTEITAGGKGDEAFLSIGWAPDGVRLSSIGPDKMWVWDTVSGKLIWSGDANDDFEWTSWSPDGKWLSFSGQQAARLIDGRSLKEVSQLTGAEGVVDWHPRLPRVATGRERTIKILSVPDGKVVQTWAGHDDTIDAIAWSPDGNRIATGGRDGRLRVWTSGGKQLFDVKAYDGEKPESLIMWSPDGARLATTAFGYPLKVRDSENGKEILTIEGGILSMANWSHDGKWLAVTSITSGYLKILDGRTLRAYAQIPLPRVSAHVEWNPDNSRLAVNQITKRVQVYDMSPFYTPSTDALLSLAKTRIKGSLAQQDCRRYFHSDTCPALP